MPQEASIFLSRLSIGYTVHRRARVVASSLSACALPGTLTCLLGRNGTGKSTLLRTIARLQPPLDGKVEIGGKPIDAFSREELARTVAVVLTQRPDAANLTVRQLVELGRAPYTGFWGRLSADDRRVVDEAIGCVGMEHMALRRIASLSDGEMQKVMIAKSLAQQTPVILLDEPTAFLDFPGKIDILLLLKRLAHDERKTILLSTHDLETALHTADRLWLLGDGAIDEGTPSNLARGGQIERYIDRDDVALDRDTLNLRILHTKC